MNRPREFVATASKLWADGLSRHTIAAQMGVGVGTIVSIIDKHPDEFPIRESLPEPIPVRERRSRVKAGIKTGAALRAQGPWTEERIQRLSELWGEGHATSEIAFRLHTTKNAVIGISRRLGLPRRPSPIKRNGPAVPRAPRRVTASLPPLLSLMQDGPRLPLHQQAAYARRPPMPVAVPAVPVPPLTPPNRAGDGCQWTDSNCRPWVFCGKPVTFRNKAEEDGSRSIRWSAYCETHHCRCYTARPALVAEAA